MLNDQYASDYVTVRFDVKAAAVALASILITIFRRPDQLSYPGVWVEEGSQFIPQFLESGWAFLFQPVNGYLIVPSKLLALVAYHISFVHYPAVSYALTLLGCALIAVAICKAPTHLPFKPLAALVPFLLPMNAEPIGVGEYLFWFGGLLSALALFWRADHRPRLRATFALVGGLSGPLGASLTPLFLARAIRTRAVSDLTTLAAAALTAIVQMAALTSVGAGAQNRLWPPTETPVESVLMFIRKFVSDFFWAAEPMAIFGVVAILVAAYWCWLDVQRHRYTAPALLVCALISALLACARVPLEPTDAMGNGPRYFFYPFLFIGWAMLVFAAEPARRKAVALAGALALVNTATFFSRGHDPLDWTGAARTCLVEPGTHELPVQFGGDANDHWIVALTRDECRRLDLIALF